MDYLKKVGYLKGLTAGLGLDKSTPERRVLLAIMDVLDDMADALHELTVSVNTLDSECDNMADELEHLSEDVEDMEGGFAEFARMFGGLGEQGGKEPLKLFPGKGEAGGEKGDGEEPYLYAVSCPVCEKEFSLTEDMLTEGGINCPLCGERLEFDVHLCEDDEEDGGPEEN